MRFFSGERDAPRRKAVASSEVSVFALSSDFNLPFPTIERSFTRYRAVNPRLPARHKTCLLALTRAGAS
jgi:hypothetical protein